MIARKDARMVQGIKQLLHEQIGMGWRDRCGTEEAARGSRLAASHPRDSFKEFLSRKGPGLVAGFEPQKYCRNEISINSPYRRGSAA